MRMADPNFVETSTRSQATDSTFIRASSLPRRLGLWSAVAVLVGSTIGSGIFRKPASVAQRIDDVPLFLPPWVVGAIIVLVGTVNFFGIHRGAVLQNLSTIFKVGALAALILVGFALGSQSPDLPAG